MKTDTNAFIRMDVLGAELLARDNTPTLYMGYFVTGGAPGSVPVKYPVPIARHLVFDPGWNLCDSYLPYAIGGGYIIGADHVDFIGSNAKRLQTFFNEDATTGSWLAPIVTTRVHDTRFATWSTPVGCNDTDVVIKRVNESEMAAKYARVVAGGSPCETANQSDTSRYTYNFQTLPEYAPVCLDDATVYCRINGLCGKPPNGALDGHPCNANFTSQAPDAPPPAWMLRGYLYEA